MLMAQEHSPHSSNLQKFIFKEINKKYLKHNLGNRTVFCDSPVWVIVTLLWNIDEHVGELMFWDPHDLQTFQMIKPTFGENIYLKIFTFMQDTLIRA